MHLHQSRMADLICRVTAIPAALFRPIIRILRFGLAAATPFILFALALAGCLLALLPAAEQPSTAATSSLFSQPTEVLKGPGRYIHITGRIRLSHGSGFNPSPDAHFVPIEFWYNEKAGLNWCVKTPGALAYSSAKDSCIFMANPHGDDVVAQTLYSVSYSQVPFVGHLMWGRELFPLEGSIARCRNSAVASINCKDNHGNQALQVTIVPSCQTANPVTLTDSWFNPAYAKTYTVDATSHDLLEVSVSTSVNGTDIVLFETDSITYTFSPNPPKPLTAAINNATAAAGADPSIEG